MQRKLAVLAGLGVVVLWASAFPAIRVAAPPLGPIGLSFVRLVVATAALLVVAAIVRVRLPRLRDLGWIVACGFFGMTAYQLLLNAGELVVPAGTASVVVAAAPLVSVGLAWALFGERVTAITVAGSVIALAGVVFVCLVRSGVSLSVAVWIVVAAMVVQGIYHPLQKPLLARYTGIEVATYAMTAGTIMTVPFVPLGFSGLVNPDAAAWSAAIYLGLLPSALGFVLWGYAVARMPVAVSTSLLYLVPPVAVLVGWILAGRAAPAGRTRRRPRDHPGRRDRLPGRPHTHPLRPPTSTPRARRTARAEPSPAHIGERSGVT